MIIGYEAQRIFRARKHGMDFVALELIKSLQRIDTRNQYVVFTNDGPDCSCLHESENLKIVTFGASFPVWEQVLLPRYAAEHNCDILHCTSNTAPVYCKMPKVITLHDIIYFENNPLFAKGYTNYQRFGNYYRRLVVGMNLTRVAKTVTVSNFERKRLIEFLNLQEDKVEVVYNGVAPHFLEEPTSKKLKEVQARYKLPPRYLLFLGNTDPKKNTQNTILAYARYVKDSGDDISLVVADLDPRLIQGLLAKEGLGEVASKIYDTGYIDNKDFPAVLAQSVGFLYPSKRESFGIPIIEAMACGVRVVTSDAASMPEVAGGHAFLVNPLEVQSIKEGIERMIQENPAEAAERISQGKKHAAGFSWQNSARQMLEIYSSVKI